MTTPAGAALPRDTVALVRHFEGRYLGAYLCPAGVPTIGYGHTGPDVRLGMTISQDDADALLAADLDAAAADVDRLVHVRLSPNQRGALASFVFNLGPGALASSTLLRRLNEDDFAGGADEFGKWVYATVGGRKAILDGLVTRRAAERALFLGLDWRAATSVSGTAQPHPMPQMLDAPAGADDDRIRRIQRAVGVKVDGIYGPATAAAVATWQRAHGLCADRIVGPITAAAMGLE